MSKRINGRNENGDRGNGYHEVLTTQVLDRDFDIEAEASAPDEMVEPLSPEDLCERVRDFLWSAEIHHKVTWERDEKGREGLVIWYVNRADELKITNALAEFMTFQVGEYVEPLTQEEDGFNGEFRWGMVIFNFSIKGRGTHR